MPIYAGETVRLAFQAKDYDATTVLTPDNVTSSEITIYDADGVVLLGPIAMDFDSVANEWYYDWDTTAIDAATFRARFELEGVDFRTWEYQRFRLNRNPV